MSVETATGKISNIILFADGEEKINFYVGSNEPVLSIRPGVMEYNGKKVVDASELYDAFMAMFGFESYVPKVEQKTAIQHRVLLLASYCGDDNPECSDESPCVDCLKMCNVAVTGSDSLTVLGGLDTYRRNPR